MKSVAGLIENVSCLLDRLIVVILQVSVGVLILDLNLAVLFRYLLKLPIVGTQEIALFLLAWITFLGASLSIKHHSMVAVTIVLEKLGKFAKAAQVLIQIVIFLFSLLFLLYGYQWVTSPHVLQIKTSALQLPAWIPYSIVPVSMMITMIFALHNIIRIFSGNAAAGKREEEML
ncbi:TRAP transporter small permease [Brevibacillus marinus]|uniref:TRAP transporter small permease n=1 Tax=Brevibacillus marinus TaxID=2496837 RepID=UPI000F82E71F|nr:TRAP transporter small permease [Brevibacillus marinus]